MCDAEKKALKEDYKVLLNKGLTPEGITAVAAVVASVISLSIRLCRFEHHYLWRFAAEARLDRFCSAPV